MLKTTGVRTGGLAGRSASRMLNGRSGGLVSLEGCLPEYLIGDWTGELAGRYTLELKAGFHADMQTSGWTVGRACLWLVGNNNY